MARTRDVELGVTEWGAADASRTALLVHGLTGRAETFEALVERLDPARGIPGGPWRFVAPDLRGRGASKEVGGEGGISEHAEDLLGLVEREGLEDVVLIGHSMGAMIGVHLASKRSGLLRGLVLLDGGSDVTDETVALTASAVERLKGTYPSREAYLEHLKSQPIFESRWDEHLERYFAGDVRPGDDGRWYPVADAAAVEKDREQMRGLQLSERWPGIRCPTLVLRSTVGLKTPEEGFILPPQDARRAVSTIPDCTLVEVEDTNHYDVLYSAPKATVEAVRAFLARLGGRV